MKDATATTITLSARTPKRLVAMLDKAARAARRSRSAELLFRLEQSFEKAPAGKAAGVGQ